MNHSFTYQHDPLSYYAMLLQRYARMLLREEHLAAELVKKVLYDQHCIDGLAPSDRLRNILLTDLRNRCAYAREQKIFDRGGQSVRYSNRGAEEDLLLKNTNTEVMKNINTGVVNTLVKNANGCTLKGSETTNPIPAPKPPRT